MFCDLCPEAEPAASAVNGPMAGIIADVDILIHCHPRHMFAEDQFVDRAFTTYMTASRLCKGDDDCSAKCCPVLAVMLLE